MKSCNVLNISGYSGFCAFGHVTLLTATLLSCIYVTAILPNANDYKYLFFMIINVPCLFPV